MAVKPISSIIFPDNPTEYEFNAQKVVAKINKSTTSAISYFKITGIIISGNNNLFSMQTRAGELLFICAGHGDNATTYPTVSRLSNVYSKILGMAYSGTNIYLKVAAYCHEIVISQLAGTSDTGLEISTITEAVYNAGTAITIKEIANTNEIQSYVTSASESATAAANSAASAASSAASAASAAVSTKLNIDGSNATTAGTSVIVHSLGTATGDVTDNTEIITSNANGYSSSDTQYYRRAGSKFWNYIKGKLDTARGRGNRTIVKTDNSGWKTWILMYDVTSSWNVSSGGAKSGFIGNVLCDRGNATASNTTVIMDIACAIAYNGKSSRVFTYSSQYGNSAIVLPCCIKYVSGSTTKYYLALELRGSSFNGYMEGRFWGTWVGTEIKATNANGAMPSGYSIEQSWSQGGYVTYSSSSNYASYLGTSSAYYTKATLDTAIGNKMNKNNAVATGTFNHGASNTVSGTNAFASGNNCKALAQYSHAEGTNTEATGDASHAEGYYTIANGIASHAEGYYTIAHDCQHVQGQYNVEDTNNYFIDIIGGGTGELDRKNIEATDWDGNKYLKGDIFVGCNDDSTGGYKLGDTTPIGTIIAFAGNSPNGYLLCDGSTVSRKTYADLFSVIGTYFGAGDGSTTFKLPDLRGKFPRGADSSNALGGTGGADSVTLTTAQIPSHTHSHNHLLYNGGTSARGNLYGFGYQSTQGDVVAGGESGEIRFYNGNTGGGQSHENRPRFQSVNYYIKAQYVSGQIPTGATLNDSITTTNNLWSANKINNVIYDPNAVSTTETRCGTWAGKPLYRKLINFTGFTATNGVTKNHNIPNVSHIHINYGLSYLYGNGYAWPLAVPVYSNGQVDNAVVCVNTTKCIWYAQTSWGSTWQWYVVLEYTKTTD